MVIALLIHVSIMVFERYIVFYQPLTFKNNEDESNENENEKLENE